MKVPKNLTILDILDKSENKSEDMISILQYIHETFIPHTEGDNPVVLSRKVFGGDVLTNERAYSAQLAMLNGSTDFDQLAGVIHRPKGLHRMMNLLLVFHLNSSAFPVQLPCFLNFKRHFVCFFIQQKGAGILEYISVLYRYNSC